MKQFELERPTKNDASFNSVISIMLRLRKIERDKDYITAEYYPEEGEEGGYLKISKNGKIIEVKKTTYDEMCNTYCLKAMNYLMSIRNDEEIPKEKTILWY